MESLLKYGAIGLTLALCVLVYHFFRSAFKKDKLTRDNYYVLFLFIGFVVIVMTIWIVVEQHKGSAPNKKIVSHTAYTWTQYSRLGYTLKLPDVFRERSITNEIQYFQSTISSDITLTIDCRLCNTITRADELHQYYNREVSTSPNVVYQIFKDNFFVVTGNGGRSYYRKGLLKNNSFYMLSIEYPPKYQSTMNDLISVMSLSFK